MLTRWSAALLRARRDSQARAGAVGLIALVFAITAGTVMAGVAGARRSDAAYDRFLRWAHNPELTFGGSDCDGAQLSDEFDRIRAQPFARETARFGCANVVVELPGGRRPSFLALLPAVDYENRIGRDVPRLKMMHGRLPAADA